MIDSLENYRILVECDSEEYVDSSGLFEIIESAYIQLCQNDPWFNAYTDYSYYNYNVVKEHQIEISKLLDLDGNRKIFSRVMIYKYTGSRHFNIYRVDYKDKDNDTYDDETLEYEFGSGTFGIIYNYMKDWFDEFLICVKNYKPTLNRDEQ